MPPAPPARGSAARVINNDVPLAFIRLVDAEICVLVAAFTSSIICPLMKSFSNVFPSTGTTLRGRYVYLLRDSKAVLRTRRELIQLFQQPEGSISGDIIPARGFTVRLPASVLHHESKFQRVQGYTLLLSPTHYHRLPFGLPMAGGIKQPRSSEISRVLANSAVLRREIDSS